MIDLNIDLDSLYARKNLYKQIENAAKNGKGHEKRKKPFTFLIHECFTQNILIVSPAKAHGKIALQAPFTVKKLFDLALQTPSLIEFHICANC